MSTTRAVKAAGSLVLAALIGFGTAGQSSAAGYGGSWQGEYETTGKTQATGAHNMKAGTYFLHFGVRGNGRHKVTAKVYRAVGRPDYTKHHNDVLVQTTPRAADDRGGSWMANPKRYAKGTYYIVFSYSVKGKKAFGGVQAG
ncbi:hypothetical protein ACIRPX_35870 [Streptomyces sp. NPDC101225]|uniref:hypothetical protein n=1 Tax=Streptomyces sp. NPDC101225 TaxID=3366135 RepID=UPI0037FD4C06